MSVKVSIFGAEVASDEYQSAVLLKKIIKESVPDTVTGEIVLFASATLMGQAVKDVDLMMIGKLDNYYVNAEFIDENNKFQNNNVLVSSFCTTIEIKRHDESGIMRTGTDFYVRYGKSKHCVTLQSNKQKISAMNFFLKTISFSPYITNIIWFTQATKESIDGLCITDTGERLITNIIWNRFSFSELMQLLIYQRQPVLINGKYVFDSNNNCSVDDIQKALMLFSKTKESAGALTRRRIEQITSRAFEKAILIDNQGRVSICRGRAGTGKTVGLIQAAIKLVDEEQARVLMLTYNKALVSDIRRLFALAELPDMFESSCVHISTLHSYFYKLANAILYGNKLNGDKFLNNYNAVMKELRAFLSDDESLAIVRELCSEDLALDWNYVLIDEAQDWSNLERDIILKMFDQGRIIVADGGQQFVRNIDVCDWSVVKNRNNIKLKYCLRQKENLVKFINVFTERQNVISGKILSRNDMPGGNVIIVDAKDIASIVESRLDCLVKSGNIPYDLLLLVPYTQVTKNNGESCCILKTALAEQGIAIWDGTSNQNREEYSVNMNEIRVLQYESARGLEGWTVVCSEFDTFLEHKEESYVDGIVDSLLLETPEERKKKHLLNWALIPFTRAIDTLVITLKDPESLMGVMLKSIAEEYPDFVTWMAN